MLAGLAMTNLLSLPGLPKSEFTRSRLECSKREHRGEEDTRAEEDIVGFASLWSLVSFASLFVSLIT